MSSVLLLSSVTALLLSSWPTAVRSRSDTLPNFMDSAMGPWGGWGGFAYCPANTWVAGFQMKVEGGQGGGDDTAANAVRMLCAPREWSTASELIGREATNNGAWGGWGSEQTCPAGQYVTWMRTKVEAPIGSGDDTALNDLQLFCGDGTYVSSSNGGAWGGWGNWESCGTGYVCGFRQKVEGGQGGGDDTALNGVETQCCSQDNSWDFSGKYGEWEKIIGCTGCSSTAYSVMHGTAVTDTSGKTSETSKEFSASLTVGFEAGFAFGSVSGSATVGTSIASSTAYETSQSVEQTTQVTTTVTCGKQYLYQWMMRAYGALGDEQRNFDVATSQYLCTDVLNPRCPLGVTDADADYQNCPSFSGSMVTNLPRLEPSVGVHTREERESRHRVVVNDHDDNNNGGGDYGTMLGLMRDVKQYMTQATNNKVQQPPRVVYVNDDPEKTSGFFDAWELTDIALVLFIAMSAVAIAAILVDCIRKMRNSRRGAKVYSGAYQVTSNNEAHSLA